MKEAETVLRDPRTTSWEKGFAEVTLKMMPGHLNESPAMMHVCTSPIPFLFMCYQGRSFGPLYGWGNGYIGVYTGSRIIKPYELQIWES